MYSSDWLTPTKGPKEEVLAAITRLVYEDVNKTKGNYSVYFPFYRRLMPASHHIEIS